MTFPRRSLESITFDHPTELFIDARLIICSPALKVQLLYCRIASPLRSDEEMEITKQRYLDDYKRELFHVEEIFFKIQFDYVEWSPEMTLAAECLAKESYIKRVYIMNG